MDKGSCLLIINSSSGRSEKRKAALLDRLNDSFDSVTVEEFDGNYGENYNAAVSADKYDTVAICGGDGTFSTTLDRLQGYNGKVLFIKGGTLNDFCNSLKRDKHKADRIDIGSLNGETFNYVAAVGTFTGIGAHTDGQLKKRIGRFAYFLEVIKNAKIQRINAQISTGSQKISGEYTLIMVCKSRVVFGFPFNRGYCHSSGKGNILLIKSPNGFLRYIKLFALFFRCFVLGFKKEKQSKNISFLDFSTLSLKLSNEETACIDGEAKSLQTNNIFSIKQRKIRL
ncbi:MAG: hypothetical protein LBN25_04660 [Christensenellaceae bacterium]|jgi:diacylglycerol kinase family enzyme|nr:hypothetical protein [Christensenellaceae bacterium]